MSLPPPGSGAGAGAGPVASLERKTTIKDIPQHLLKDIIEMACPKVIQTNDYRFPLLQKQLIARKRLVCKHFNEAIGSNTQTISFRRYAPGGFSLDFTPVVQERIFSSIFSPSSYSRLKGIDFSLIVHSNKLGNSGVIKLADAMTSKQLVEINLSNNEIGATGMQYLFRSLHTNPIIRVLHLKNNVIGLRGIKTLAQFLTTNHSLQDLDLSNNKMTDKEIQILCPSICTNRTIQKLVLTENKITHIGATHIGNMLTLNSSLQVLYLNANPISNEGVIVISNALTTNNHLKKLYLRHCDILKEGIEALFVALKTNTSLSSLILFGNQLGFRCFQILSEVIEINRTLSCLDITCYTPPEEYGFIPFHRLAQNISRNKVLHCLHFENQLSRQIRDILTTMPDITQGAYQHIHFHEQGHLARWESIITVGSIALFNEHAHRERY